VKISEVYEKYKIMPNLQEHMLRVTGAASIITSNLLIKTNNSELISACLLHDMGNMSKFKLGVFPENLKPQGYDYWYKIQQEFIDKYGKDDHEATINICNELKIKKGVVSIIEKFGFKNTEKTRGSTDLLVKIGVYSDMRTSPNGVTTIGEKLNESKVRYLRTQQGTYTAEQFDKFIPIWFEIEKQIFDNCKINPEDITEEKVKPLFNELLNFDIKTN
jgi:hypothetical protein